MIVKIDPQDALTVKLARERLYALSSLLAKIAAERYAAELAIQLSDTQRRQAETEKEHLEAEAFALSEQMAQKYGIEPTDNIDWDQGVITKATASPSGAQAGLVDAARAGGLPGADTAVFGSTPASGPAGSAFATTTTSAATRAGATNRSADTATPQGAWATFGSGEGDPGSANGGVQEG